MPGQNEAGWELTPFVFQRKTEKWLKKRTNIVIRVRIIVKNVSSSSLIIMHLKVAIKCYVTRDCEYV